MLTTTNATIANTTMNSTVFSLNLVSDLRLMMQYGFMRHAFEAGTIVAIIAGIIGYFIVLRRSSFAAHALSHIGFAGAAGAVLFGINPIVGLLVFTSGEWPSYSCRVLS